MRHNGHTPNSPPLPCQQSKPHFSSPTCTNNTFFSYPISILQLHTLQLFSTLYIFSFSKKITSKGTILQATLTITMDTTTQTQPLQDRPTNTHLSNVDKTDVKGKDLASMEYHRQVLQGKLDSGEK